MPTVIDAFLVKLTLDGSGFEKGRKENDKSRKELKDGWDKTGKDLAKSNREIADSFTKISRSAAGVVATVVGANGLAEYIGKTVVQFSNLDRAAKAAGLSVSQFRAFGDVIAKNGGDANVARGSVAGLASQLYQWRTFGTASTGLITAAQQTGIQSGDNALGAIDKFAKWAQGRNPQEVSAFGQMLGLDEATIDQAMKGQGALRGAMSDAMKNQPSQDAVTKVRDLQKSWADLTQAVVGDANALLADWSPAMSGVLKLVTEGIQKFPELTKAILLAGVAATGLSGLGMVRGLLGLGGGAAAAGAGAATAGGGIGSALLGAALSPLGVTAAAGAIIATPTQLANSDRPNNLAARKAAIRNYLLSHNVPGYAVDGIVAGMMAENGGLDPGATNPTAAGDGSHAHGLLQLTGARQAAYRKATGKDWGSSSMTDQLAWMIQEFNGPEKRAYGRILGAGNAQGSMAAYVKDYMRPGEGEVAGDLMRGNRALGAGSADVTVNTGPVTINTQATDAAGIAADFNAEMLRQSMAAQANTGQTP